MAKKHYRVLGRCRLYCWKNQFRIFGSKNRPSSTSKLSSLPLHLVLFGGGDSGSLSLLARFSADFCGYNFHVGFCASLPIPSPSSSAAIQGHRQGRVIKSLFHCIKGGRREDKAGLAPIFQGYGRRNEGGRDGKRQKRPFHLKSSQMERRSILST